MNICRVTQNYELNSHTQKHTVLFEPLVFELLSFNFFSDILSLLTMLDLVNFTKREYTSVGKPGEQPIIQVLHFMCKEFGWDLTNDKIEVIRDREIVEELGHPPLKEFDDMSYSDEEYGATEQPYGIADREHTEIRVVQSAWTNRSESIDWQQRDALWDQLKM